MKYLSYLLYFFCFVPLYSLASLHIEPYGGVGGAFSTSASPSSSYFMKYTAGGRLGYKVSIVSAGLDIFYTYYDTGLRGDVTIVQPAKPKKGFEVGSLSISSGEKRTAFQPFAIGFFTAVQLPLLFNTYGSLFYAFGKKDKQNHQGYGLKAGISWLSPSYIQLNLSAKYAYYTCRSCNNNFSILSAFLSVSVPLSFNLFANNTSLKSKPELESKSKSTEEEFAEESEEV